VGSLEGYFPPEKAGRFALCSVLFVALMLGGLATAAEGNRLVSICPLSPDPASADCEPPLLRFRLGATISPQGLPAHEFAPAALELKGGMSKGAKQAPALREMIVDIDKDMTMAPTGLSSCTGDLLRSRNAGEARHVCRDSIVGLGNARVITNTEAQNDPIPLKVTLFNQGASDNRWRLYIHFSGDPSLSLPTVSKAVIRKRGGGLQMLASFPRLADGAGSLLDFDFSIGRSHGHRRAHSAYLLAKCPDRRLDLTFPRILFRNEASIPGVAPRTTLSGKLGVSCKPL
jgi:hypothetical protein